MRIHVIESGRLVSNKTFLRSESWSALLRRREDFEFPVHSFVLETEEGLVAIDSGLRPGIEVPRAQRRFVPTPSAEHDMASRMREKGLEPAEVTKVVVTHLDWDHVGGVATFPNAEVLVNRPEWDFASTRMGRMRYQTAGWPDGFAPALYDLDPDPVGPFPASKAITEDGNVRVVPIPGHSIGQVGVVVAGEDRRLFFVADHMLRADWFVDDYAAGRHLGLGMFFPALARATSHRIHEFTRETGAVLVPSHDAEVLTRLDSPAQAEVRTLGR